MTDLPAWSGDTQAMLRWLGPKLSEKLRDRYKAKYKAIAAQWKRKLTPREQAMLSANKGNVEPLRRYLVERGDADIARFVDLPKLARGQKWKPAKKRLVQPPEIAEWAKIIREIWREHYGVKQRRKPEWTAEEFAFALYMMDAEVEVRFDPNKREEVPDTGKRWSDRAAEKK